VGGSSSRVHPTPGCSIRQVVMAISHWVSVGVATTSGENDDVRLLLEESFNSVIKGALNPGLGVDGVDEHHVGHRILPFGQQGLATL